MALNKNSSVESCAISKAITLDEHIEHAASHLRRAGRHMEAVKEQHGHIGSYANLLNKSADDDALHNGHVLHHALKASEFLGRAAEQQKMATRHLGALTGDPKFAGNQLYKDGDASNQMAGAHLDGAIDGMGQMMRHAVAPAYRESPSDVTDRKAHAVRHLTNVGQHIDTALDRIQNAADSLDRSLTPVKAQEDNVGSPEDTALAPTEKSVVVPVTQTPKENLAFYKTSDGFDAFKLFVPFQKLEQAEMESLVKGDDGQPIKVPGLLVKGWGSVSDYVDSQGDIVTAKALREAVMGASDDAYAKWGNVRSMHMAKAIGSAPVIDIRKHPETGTDALWMECFIVDQEEIKKFISGIYKGFSIGGQCLEAEMLPDEADKEAA